MTLANIKSQQMQSHNQIPPLMGQHQHLQHNKHNFTSLPHNHHHGPSHVIFW